MSRKRLKFNLGNKVIFPSPDRTRSSVEALSRPPKILFKFNDLTIFHQWHDEGKVAKKKLIKCLVLKFDSRTGPAHHQVRSILRASKNKPLITRPSSKTYWESGIW